MTKLRLAAYLKICWIERGQEPGSSTCTSRSTRTCVKVCTIPLGQRISIVASASTFPKPKCTRGSLADRYELDVVTVAHCEPHAVVNFTTAPIPSRLLLWPVRRSDSQ